MKMYEAAQTVLRNAGRPMTANEIYDEIIKNQLFTFGAKDPVAVLKQTLRKKSQAENPIFTKVESNKFQLAT